MPKRPCIATNNFMPHKKPPPRPPPPFPIRPDPDERDDIRALVRAINASTEAANALTEWLRANRAAVTRADLNAATEKVLKAIGAGSDLKGVEVAWGRMREALDRLDAQVPDAPK